MIREHGGIPIGFKGLPIIILFQKIARYLQKPVRFQGLFILSLGLLGICRLAIIAVKFRRLARYFGAEQSLTPQIPVIDAIQTQRAKSIGQAVRTAAGYTFWRSDCFPQALTALILLKWYQVPYTLFFGVDNKDPQGELIAHCWIASGRIAVTGGRPFHKYTIVGVFLSDDRP